jgi:ankyrin repeat protein/cell wall assembly regulator SMI1
MAKALWEQWQRDWRWMEATARRRSWSLTPLSISPPATAFDLTSIETHHGLNFPPQLRELLTGYSRHVEFGWYIPPHLQPLEKLGLPNMSANRSAIWSIEHIRQHAIPNFLGWKNALASKDRSEAPNTPEMWESQFPFYSLVNGDMLTIDMSVEDGPQPVRYFSHELQTLHGMALAPDFFAFITEMSKLGFAGTEWASWGKFGSWEEPNKTYYIKADSTGGQEWLAWLARDDVRADEPPPAIVEETAAERQLLDAARSGNVAAAIVALGMGARPDVVPNPDWLMENMAWNDEFSTPLTYSVQANHIGLAQTLLDHGATLNTRRLVTGDAVQTASPKTLEWLIERGARIDGWKDDRFWPLHLLVTRRSETTARTRSELETRLRKDWGLDKLATTQTEREMHAVQEKLVQQQLAAWLDRPTYLAMLRTLLEAGATVDAPWDNGMTMLMWAEEDDARVLLKAGANPNARDAYGSAPLHIALRNSVAKIHLLVAHGAEIDALQAPPLDNDVDRRASTPLQSALTVAGLGRLDGVQALLELKADPLKRDRDGRSALCYSTTVASFRLMQGYGLDPNERMPDGGTLLHNLFEMTSVRAAFEDEVAMLDLLLSLGLPVNAQDNQGRTMLHKAAERTEVVDDIALLLDRGADRLVRDKDGKRPVDLVPGSLDEIRSLLG